MTILDIVYCGYCEKYSGLVDLNYPEKFKVPFFITYDNCYYETLFRNCFLCKECNEKIGKGKHGKVRFSYARY